MAKFAALLSLVLFAVGCGKSPSQKLTALSEEFVYGSLAFSPSAATAAGLHQYQKQNLDEMLDDFGDEISPGSALSMRSSATVWPISTPAS